jgi:hypothetical protein
MISFALYFSLLYLGHYSMRGFGAKIGRELQHAGGLRNARIAFKGSILFSPRSYWVCLLALLKCAVSLLKRRKTTPPDVRNSRHVYSKVYSGISCPLFVRYIYIPLILESNKYEMLSTRLIIVTFFFIIIILKRENVDMGI